MYNCTKVGTFFAHCMRAARASILVARVTHDVKLMHSSTGSKDGDSPWDIESLPCSKKWVSKDVSLLRLGFVGRYESKLEPGVTY